VKQKAEEKGVRGTLSSIIEQCDVANAEHLRTLSNVVTRSTFEHIRSTGGITRARTRRLRRLCLFYSL